jgi:hypothetical protein
MCHKRTYHSEAEAIRTATGLSLAYATNPQIAYECRECPPGTWHLTANGDPTRKLKAETVQAPEYHRQIADHWNNANRKQLRHRPHIRKVKF